MRQRHVVAALALAAMLLFLCWMGVRGDRQDWPWTPLDLGETPGRATGPKLVALADHPATCRALLTRAGVRFQRLAPRHEGPRCGFTDAVRLTAGGSRRLSFAPNSPTLSCPVAAALAMWEWNVVQPAALRSFGTPVVGVEQLGSYNCRHIAGRASWSEHATANALDVAGFRLADGRRVSVAGDWRNGGPEATFLHAVRAGACPLFATVLSPDYNSAHRDHLHLDQAARGGWGWRACR